MPRKLRRPDTFPPIVRSWLLVTAAPSVAFATEGSTVPGLGEMALRAGAALGLVIALIAALALLFRRLRAPGSPVPHSRRLVAVDRLDLGARREIRLLRVEERLLLVGVTDHRIDLLSELPGDRTQADDPQPLASRLGVLRKLTTSS